MAGRELKYSNSTGLYSGGMNTGRSLPPLTEYEIFCDNYLKLHPKTDKKSVFRDPKRLRAMSLAWRTPSDRVQIASRFGLTSPTISLLLSKLPTELR
jgi:hypothetical protein